MASSRSALRIAWLVLQTPRAVLAYFGAPAVSSSRRSFLPGQRRLLVGVVLAAAEHAREQDRQLAGGGDDRLAVPAAGARAVIEGVQRPRLQDHAPGRLDQRPARGRRAALADPAAARRSLAGLADLRVQAEVGHQLAAAQEPYSGLPDGGDERRRADQVHARGPSSAGGSPATRVPVGRSAARRRRSRYRGTRRGGSRRRPDSRSSTGSSA